MGEKVGGANINQLFSSPTAPAAVPRNDACFGFGQMRDVQLQTEAFDKRRRLSSSRRPRIINRLERGSRKISPEMIQGSRVAEAHLRDDGAPKALDDVLGFSGLGEQRRRMDLIDEILAEPERSRERHRGFRRSVIAKMGLRDAAALDQFQDEIFRLPLSQPINDSWSSGTGKTTTLIKRLGLKLDVSHLTESETSIVARTAAGASGSRIAG